MRNLHTLDRYRRTDYATVEYYGSVGDGTCGAFLVPSPSDRQLMVVLASSGMDWDHVSVSRKTRCPNWQEMDYVKRLFFEDHETAVQFHVPPAEHLNLHPYCLHLWRPQAFDIPLPPSITVALPGDTAPLAGGADAADR